MALATDILLWLPLQRLLNLDFLTPGLVGRRLALLNQVSTEAFETFSRSGPEGDFRDKYLRLCSFQGEVIRESLDHLFPREVLMRAAFLRDEDVCLFVIARLNLLQSSSATKRLLMQSVLETDLPAVQMSFLSRFEPTDDILIIDPESINWTPDLCAYFSRYLEVQDRGDGNWTYQLTRPDAAVLVGYLQLIPMSVVGKIVLAQPNSSWQTVFIWQIKAILRQEPARNGAIPEVQEFLRSRAVRYHSRLTRKITMAGYVDSRVQDNNVPSELFAALRADEFLRFAQPGLQIFVSELRHRGIGRDTVRRAQILQGLLESGQIKVAPHMQAFLPELQILAGRPVSGELPVQAWQLAWTLGHPAATVRGMGEYGELIRASNVKFNALHLAQFSDQLSTEDLTSLTLQLAAYGQLYQATALFLALRKLVLGQ